MSLLEDLEIIAKANALARGDNFTCPIKVAIAEIMRLRKIEDAVVTVISEPWEYERSGKTIAENRQAAGKYLLENAKPYGSRA